MNHLWEFDCYRVDFARRLLLRGAELVQLPAKALDTLLVLIQRRAEVVTKEDLIKAVWPDAFVEEGNLSQSIHVLRRALGESVEEHRYIVTVPGRGYRFVADVREIPEIKGDPASSLSASSLPSRVMLAVLPFEDISRQKDEEYFSDGLTEEMITQLGRMNPEWLGVIARTSAMHYKDCDRTVQQIGCELGVSYVLEGSVRRVGRRVRVTAQLIQVADQTHLWAESYDCELGNILALQNDVACAIADEIRIKLRPQERARLGKVRPVNPEAYEAYLKGRYFWNKRTKEALEKSVPCFERAIEKDPDYASAYAGLADSYCLLANTAYGALPPKEAFSKARVATLKALEIDKTLAEAHASLAQLDLYEFDWLAAERELRRSIELNPGFAVAHHWYALYLSAKGRFKEALAEANRAYGLDPLSVIINRDLGLIYYYARQPDRAIEQYRKTLELDPNFALAHQALGRAYLEMGMYTKGVEEIQLAVRLSGESVGMLAALAHAYGLAGKTEKARGILGDLMERSRRSYVPPTSIAVIYAGLGEKENALEWLEKAWGEQDVGLHTLKVHPIFNGLCTDPRFQDLLRRMNLAK
jgi:TolB-like protein/Tfp pilus assembly protein PilF